MKNNQGCPDCGGEGTFDSITVTCDECKTEISQIGDDIKTAESLLVGKGWTLRPEYDSCPKCASNE